MDKAQRKIKDTNIPIGISGQNTKSFYGNPFNKNCVSINTLDYSGILEYDPSELFVVARSGTPLNQLEEVLLSNNQTLGFDPPRFSHKEFSEGGSVGGMVATGLSGPSRIFYGSCRESVLGLSVIDGNGRILRFGGNVIKNVAGYDVSRLHVGAMGTLGLLLDISLRVRPIAMCESTISIPASFEEMIQMFETFFMNHLPISSTSWTNKNAGFESKPNTLFIKLSGSKSTVESGKEFILKTEKKASDVEKNTAVVFWNAIRDQKHGFFLDNLNKNEFLYRLSLPFGEDFTRYTEMDQWVEWGGALRWIRSSESPEKIQSEVKKVGGNVMLYKVSNDSHFTADRFINLGQTEKKLHKKIKQQMDPNSIFNPGKLYSYL